MGSPDPTRLARVEVDGGTFTREWRPAGCGGPRHAVHPDALEICVMEEGTERCVLDGAGVAMSAGQCVLIEPGCEHSSWTERSAPLQTIEHLDAERVLEATAALGLRPSARPQRASRATPLELASIFGALRVYSTRDAHDPAHRLLVESMFAHLALWSAREQARVHATPAAACEHAAVVARLHDVEAAMRAAPAEVGSLDTLATAVGVSRFQLLRLWKKTFGGSPHAHLLRVRADRAAELLRTTELSVAAVALDVGFHSTGRLIDAFRRHHGTTPERWRRDRARSAHAPRNEREPAGDRAS
jgi:AraC-like DNA-binding protein/mannose-6-phosphate isomerase-like protein (cupin superfamily)